MYAPVTVQTVPPATAMVKTMPTTARYLIDLARGVIVRLGGVERRLDNLVG